MESQTQIIELLQLMDRPAFCVYNGMITGANHAALGRLVPLDHPIEPLLSTGKAEYAAFTEGWLYLTLQLSGVSCGAAVYRVGDHHVFTLEPTNTVAELKALALAAQELRNPLSSIIAITDRLFPNLSFPEDSPEAKNVARINRSLHQLQRIVSNMSDAARYTNTTPQFETRDVAAVIKELFDQAGVLCEFSGIRLEYEGPSVPVFSLIDPEQLERGIYNALSNALRVSPQGSTIQVRLRRSGNILYLTIQDSGPGISPSSVGNVFTRFMREPALSDGNHGLGLGMTLIRACASAHAGTVLLDPSCEKGLRLTMSLPIRLDSPKLRSSPMRVDYAGERSHGLIELADTLPYELYKPNKHH